MEWNIGAPFARFNKGGYYMGGRFYSVIDTLGDMIKLIRLGSKTSVGEKRGIVRVRNEATKQRSSNEAETVKDFRTYRHYREISIV